MSFENSSIYLSKGTRFRVGSSDLPNVQTISGLGSGGAVEIDITSLISTATEYALGLPDEGSITLDGTAALQHPIYETLNEARANGTELSFAIIVGKVPSGEKKTDGSAYSITTGTAVATSIVSTKRVYTTDAKANTFPAISEGDYVKDGSAYVKITKLAVTGEKLVITTDGTTNTNATSIDIVSPGIKMTFTGRIGSFERSAASNEVWRYSLSVRITGSVSTEVGDPDVSV